MENTVIINLSEYNELIKVKNELNAILNKSSRVTIYGNYFSVFHEDTIHVCNTNEQVSEAVTATIESFDLRKEYYINIDNELKSIKYKWWYKLFKNL